MKYRILADKNPEVFMPNVAAALNNLGVLLRDKNELDSAQKHCEEALSIRRGLTRINPDVYLRDVAATLNNLGNVLSDKNLMDRAKIHYEEAVVQYNVLADENPDVYLPYVFMTSINLGIFYKDLVEKTGEISLKEPGLTLMKEVGDRLSFYPTDHPTAIQYRKYIDYLTSFFEGIAKE